MMQAIRFALICLYSAIYLESLELLPLMVLDFGLRRPIVTSAGIVTSILLVSTELKCLGASLVCATCL